MKLNLYTILGGLVILGGGYLALQHFGLLPPIGAARATGPMGYEERSGYQGNVLPYHIDEFGQYQRQFHHLSNAQHLSSMRPPG